MSDPQTELNAARDSYMAGTMGQETYLSKVEKYGPLLGQSPSTPATSDEARQKVDDLRQRRVEGKVTDSVYFSEMDRLGPLAQTQQGGTEQQQYDALMAPPSSPMAYEIDYASGPPSTPEEFEYDAAIRTAMVDIGIPAHLGGALVDAIDRLADRLEGASDVVLQSHLFKFQSAMQERWGAEHKAKSEKVTEFLLAAAEKHPAFAIVIDEMPYALADVGVSEWLLSVVEHKSRVAA
jgi:hypothetical protein